MYPIIPIPSHPGARPPWWQFRRRRAWQSRVNWRQEVKRRTFACNYGRRV